MYKRILVIICLLVFSLTMVSIRYSDKYLSYSIVDKLSFVYGKNTATVHHKQGKTPVQGSTRYIATSISTTLDGRFSNGKNTSTVHHKQGKTSVKGSTQYIATSISTTLDGRFSNGDKNSVMLQNSSFCPSHLVPTTKSNEPNSTCFKYNRLGKHKVLKNLEKTISRIIYKLQNPKNCSTARLLVCTIPVYHGLGSLTHLFAQCIVLSLLTNRTMIADISKQSYKDIDKVFFPLSNTCAKVDISKAVDIPENTDLKSTDSYQIIKASLVIRPNLKYSVFAMPKNIAEVVECLHDDPNAWWIGQITNYLMRIKQPIIENINKVKEQINFSHPTVGLHIRRGDKFKEAKYYQVKNYMAYAERWFDCNYISKGINITKRIYIATDDPIKVIKELERNYQDYQFLHDPLIYNVSMTMGNRYEKSSLIRTLADIYILSECDYFIGTYSSNLGRLIHEIKQSNLKPVYSSFSLDRTYYYHQGFSVHHIVVQDQPDDKKKYQLKIGDEIIVNARGSSITTGFGYNLRSKVRVQYPIDKVRVMVETASYPEFF